MCGGRKAGSHREQKQAGRRTRYDCSSTDGGRSRPVEQKTGKREGVNLIVFCVWAACPMERAEQ